MAMPPAERSKVIRKLPLKPATDHTVTDPDLLLADIKAAVTRGYAQTKGENVADVMAVACPMRVEGAGYALAVAGPMGRIAPRATEYAEAVWKAVTAMI
ncbi:MAG: IclR family transcriptional regulator domain-containing protein [Janthinobacterium lividum]